jgi:hypothetical protein
METVVSYFKVLPWHSPRETEEIHGNKTVNTASPNCTCLEHVLPTNLLSLSHQLDASGLNMFCSLTLHEHPRMFYVRIPQNLPKHTPR